MVSARVPSRFKRALLEIVKDFYIRGSAHRNSRSKKSNKMQHYADISLLLNYCTCFGRPSRPSSGVHKTVVEACGTDHTVWGVTFFKRDQIRAYLFTYEEAWGKNKGYKPFKPCCILLDFCKLAKRFIAEILAIFRPVITEHICTTNYEFLPKAIL